MGKQLKLNKEIVPVSSPPAAGEPASETITNKVLTKIKGRASFYSDEEWVEIDRLYQLYGKEGALCRTCGEKITRAFQVIKKHFKL